MRNLILILLGVVTFAMTALAQPPYPYDTKYDEVFYKSFNLDTSAVDTVTGPLFVPNGDSLSFVVEIVNADSAGTTDGSQIAVDARIRYVTVSGLPDSTAYANLQSAIVKASDEGEAKFGAVVPVNNSRQGSRAKLELNVTNSEDGRQEFKVRVYAIKRWR